MRKALVIGIDNYRGAPLRCCENDANSVADLLSVNGDGSPNFDVIKLLSPQTYKEIADSIDKLYFGECEIALFYFSGHGITKKNKSFLVTPDYNDLSFGIDTEELLEKAMDSKARNKIIIIDSCFSGGIGNSMFINDNTSFIPKGVTILTASRGDEPSLEINNHGVFTNLFIEALKGGAADITGKISPSSIYSFIDKSLGSWDQRPLFKTNVQELVTLREIDSSVTLDAIRKLTTLFPSPSHLFELDPSYEFTNSLEYTIEKKEPYAVDINVEKFKLLQKFVSIGLVEPVDEEYMYFAAMNSTSCRLTALGNHYWRLVKDKRL